nr:HAMP domain-containing histidine kinase [Chloroflexota bacterium]
MDSTHLPILSRRSLARRLAAVTVAVAISVGATMMMARLVLGVQGPDARLMLWLLFLSATVSLLAGGLLIWVSAGRRWDRLGTRLAAAQLVGVLVALLNIVPTTLVMFLSPHDRGLVLLLLAYALAIALVFTSLMSASIAASLGDIRASAARMAAGDLSVRVPVASERELAELGTVFNAMAARLEAAFARQRELEEARQGLIAAVSHDLRTPLASLRVMVEAIIDGVADDPVTIRRYLGAMQRETVSLGRLIDDLFEMARLDAGPIGLRLEPSPITALIGTTLESMEAQANLQGIDLRAQFDPNLHLVVVDPDRVQRVLYNLVQNALRHTPADGTVTVEAIDLGTDVQVNVGDTGEGIASNHLPHVFEPFYRGDPAR